MRGRVVSERNARNKEGRKEGRREEGLHISASFSTQKLDMKSLWHNDGL